MLNGNSGLAFRQGAGLFFRSVLIVFGMTLRTICTIATAQSLGYWPVSGLRTSFNASPNC